MPSKHVFENTSSTEERHRWHNLYVQKVHVAQLPEIASRFPHNALSPGCFRALCSDSVFLHEGCCTPLFFVNCEHFLIKHSNSGDQAPIVCFILMLWGPSISDISQIVEPEGWNSILFI